MESYPYPITESQRYINLNPGRLFVQQPPKRERGREAHLHYYASTYNSGKQLSISHRKTKLNQIQQNTRNFSVVLLIDVRLLQINSFS